MTDLTLLQPGVLPSLLGNTAPKGCRKVGEASKGRTPKFLVDQTLAPLSSQGTLRPTVERIENQFREGEDSDTEHNQRKKEERKRGKVLILTTGICILLPPGPESPPLPFQ